MLYLVKRVFSVTGDPMKQGRNYVNEFLMNDERLLGAEEARKRLEDSGFSTRNFKRFLYKNYPIHSSLM